MMFENSVMEMKLVHSLHCMLLYHILIFSMQFIIQVGFLVKTTL